MPSMHTRPLTAQEAFEQEGFVIYVSYESEELGTKVISAATNTGVEAGAHLFIVAEATLEDAEALVVGLFETAFAYLPIAGGSQAVQISNRPTTEAFAARVGWTLKPHHYHRHFFYKAVAE